MKLCSRRLTSPGGGVWLLGALALLSLGLLASLLGCATTDAAEHPCTAVEVQQWMPIVNDFINVQDPTFPRPAESLDAALRRGRNDLARARFPACAAHPPPGAPPLQDAYLHWMDLQLAGLQSNAVSRQAQLTAQAYWEHTVMPLAICVTTTSDIDRAACKKGLPSQ